MIIMTRISAKIPHVSVALALGVMAVIGINDAWSAMERHRCQELTKTHQAIALRGFWGHTTYCVDRRYM
jgi:hypothetical protein